MNFKAHRKTTSTRCRLGIPNKITFFFSFPFFFLTKKIWNLALKLALIYSPVHPPPKDLFLPFLHTLLAGIAMVSVAMKTIIIPPSPRPFCPCYTLLAGIAMVLVAISCRCITLIFILHRSLQDCPTNRKWQIGCPY